MSGVTLPGDGTLVETIDGVGGAQRQVVQVANLPATQAVSGAVAVSNLPETQPVSVSALPLPAGAATEATIASLLTAAQAIKAAAETLAGRTINTGSIAGVVALDGATLAALEFITVQNLPATQAVTGPVTDAQLRASAVPISGTVAIAGTVTVSNPTAAGLTDAQLRAAAVPMSAAALPLPAGAATETTVAAANTTRGAPGDGAATSDTGSFSVVALIKRLLGKIPALGQATMAASQPVVLASDQPAVPVSQPNLSANGSITAMNAAPTGVATAGSAVELTLNGASALTIQVSGTYTGALSLQATVNGSTWVTLAGACLLNVNTGSYLASITSALQSILQANVGGFLKCRVTALGVVTGAAGVSLAAGIAPSMVALDAPLPAGTNSIGAVTGSVTNTPITPTALAINSAASTNATSVKAAACTLFNLVVSNTGGAAAFVKLYNKAVAPTIGTDTPVVTLAVPAGGQLAVSLGSTGYRFSAGFALGITNLAADTDTTAISAGQVKAVGSYL